MDETKHTNAGVEENNSRDSKARVADDHVVDRSSRHNMLVGGSFAGRVGRKTQRSHINTDVTQKMRRHWSGFFAKRGVEAIVAAADRAKGQ